MHNQHTPGPWLNHGCSVYSAKVWSEGIATGDRYIASSQPLDESMPSDEDLANARLIAAAPEMLEVLKLCHGNVSSLNDTHPAIWGKWLEVISAAIAKAEGQA